MYENVYCTQQVVHFTVEILTKTTAMESIMNGTHMADGNTVHRMKL